MKSKKFLVLFPVPVFNWAKFFEKTINIIIENDLLYLLISYIPTLYFDAMT